MDQYNQFQYFQVYPEKQAPFHYNIVLTLSTYTITGLAGFVIFGFVTFRAGPHAPAVMLEKAAYNTDKS